MPQGMLSGTSAIKGFKPISMLGNGLSESAPTNAVGGGDKKPKKKAATPARSYDMGAELKKFGNTPMKYDDGDTPTNISNVVGQKMGIKPSLLLASAWQEGMNKATLDPEKVSDHYKKAGVSSDYPVDGFINYGVDTIGDKWDKVKKYLPEGFENNMKFYDAVNEKGQKVKTAAFNYNENALMAKAAMMKLERENASNYAKEKGIDLDEEKLDYFMLAGYNGGEGNAKKMIDEYAADPDKANFISQGHSRNGVHKNIKVRMDNMKIADELLKQPQ